MSARLLDTAFSYTVFVI